MPTAPTRPALSRPSAAADSCAPTAVLPKSVNATSTDTMSLNVAFTDFARGEQRHVSGLAGPRSGGDRAQPVGGRR